MTTENTQIDIVFFRVSYETMGGGTKMLLRLLRGLDTDEFNITVVSQRKDEFCKYAADLDISVKIIPYPGVLNTYNGTLLQLPVYWKCIAGLRLLQYNWRCHQQVDAPDIIWCDGTRTFLTLLPYLQFTSAETILNVGLMPESTGVMKYINTANIMTADHIFIESETQARRQFTGKQYDKYQSKFTIFHKGIDVNKFDPDKYDDVRNNESFRIGTAALINPRKGLEYFIDAAALVLNQRSDVQFIIAGEPAREEDQEYQERLAERVEQHGISEHIEFMGWVEEMPEYLNSLDIFILPSYNEGIPGAVREALAMKVPVVATDVGGISEAVHHGKTGILVEPEDAEQIAERVIQLLSDQSERRKLGQQGRRHMGENFSIESYVQDYEEFLKDIAGDRENPIQ